MWLGGGAAHMDTNPKVMGDGKKKAGSYYKSIPTAIQGEFGAPGRSSCGSRGDRASR
jgi:hypothetical protein